LFCFVFFALLCSAQSPTDGCHGEVRLELVLALLAERIDLEVSGGRRRGRRRLVVQHVQVMLIL